MKKMLDTTPVLMHRNRVHPTDLFRRLNKLRHEELLCDLTIVVQGQKFKAHKVVMAACSNYFMSAILGGKSSASLSISDADTGNNLSVELHKVTIRGFSPLLDYAYTSELIVSSSDVVDVLAAASYMQMFDVTRACSNFIKTSLKDESVQTPLTYLQYWCNQSNGLSSNKQENMDNPTPEKTSMLSKHWNSFVQASADLYKNGNFNGNVPSLMQHPMLFRLPTFPALDAKLHYQPTLGASMTAVPPPYLPHASSPAITDSKDKSSPCSNVQYNISSSISETEERTNSQSYEKRSDSMNTKKSSNAIDATKNINETCLKNKDENLMSDEKNQSTQEKLPSAGIKPPHCGAVSSNLELKDVDQQRENSLLNGNASYAWNGWQQCLNTSKANVNSSLSRERKNEATPIQDAEPISSLAERLKSSLKPDTAVPNPHFPQWSNNFPMIPRLNGLTFHQHLLHRHLLAQQQLQQNQTHEEEKKNPALPAMPPSGQYTSVRRRTLQSSVPKPHQCQICGSRFTRYHNLKQHIKLHSGVKPYECDVCKKRFTRNYTLRLHKMKHVGIRNFRCSTCAAAFTSLGEFRAHLRLTMHSHMPVNSDLGTTEANDESYQLQPQGRLVMSNFDKTKTTASLGKSLNEEQSSKMMSPVLNDPKVLIGVNSLKRSWHLPFFPQEQQTKQIPSDERPNDQGFPPVKKISFGGAKLNDHRNDSNDNHAITSSIRNF